MTVVLDEIAEQSISRLTLHFLLPFRLVQQQAAVGATPSDAALDSRFDGFLESQQFELAEAPTPKS